MDTSLKKNGLTTFPCTYCIETHLVMFSLKWPNVWQFTGSKIFTWIQKNIKISATHINFTPKNSLYIEMYSPDSCWKKVEFACFLALGQMVVVGKDTSAVPAKLLCFLVWPVLVPNSTVICKHTYIGPN